MKMSDKRQKTIFEQLTSEDIELAEFLFYLQVKLTQGKMPEKYWHSLSETLDWLNEPFDLKNPFDGIGV
jgi:hypothetical protein